MKLDFAIGHPARLRVLHDGREILDKELAPGHYSFGVDTTEVPAVSLPRAKSLGVSYFHECKRLTLQLEDLLRRYRHGRRA